MVKVGILSMQRILNYGSFLQAYGLKSILEDIGCEVQFVDYHPGECLIPSNEGTGLNRKISKVFETFRYKAPFAEKLRFIRYKKNYASNYYPLLGITSEMNYRPAVDILVIGSDEVFNCVQNNTNVGYCPELFGVNSNAKKVISYAASFGNTTAEKLEQYHVSEEVGGWLNELSAISVRDKNSGSIVNKLTGGIPEFHLDPVLMYDFRNKCKEIPTSVKESNYMILYGYSGRFSEDECQAIRTYVNKKGLKVFCIGGVQNCCDRFLDCDPFEVIAYFQHADCVVTDTFHGSILSVITHRQFAAVVRNSGYGNSEKLTDLLEQLGLENRVLDRVGRLPELLDSKINYATVDKVIKLERQRTYGYLEKEIKE